MSDVMGSGNGAAPDEVVEALSDSSRFQFKRDVIDVSEFITGVRLHLKTLSVDERQELPDLVDENGKPDSSTPKLAAVFAAVVENVEIDEVEKPALSAEQALVFLGGWPTPALDMVIEKFGE